MIFLGSESATDSSVNQLASWMIEHPCVDTDVDDNGNPQVNSFIDPALQEYDIPSPFGIPKVNDLVNAQLSE